MFSYTVTCEFNDRLVAKEWIDWLREEHLRDVCDAGATDTEVIALERDEDQSSRGVWAHEVRYHFRDRATFDAYVRDHAPQLRAEGLQRFPPERGLNYARRTGEVVAVYGTSR